MKNKFIIGAMTGMSSLALAVPIFAQVSGAQSASSAATQTDQAETQGTDIQFDPKKGGHVGLNGAKEELLTGTDAERITAAALVAVPGGQIERVETDTDGDAYEAHMTSSDGTPVTVKFDANFSVTEVQEGHGGR
jgi:hypothetical protein